MNGWLMLAMFASPFVLGIVAVVGIAIHAAVSRRRIFASIAGALGGTYQRDRGSGKIGGVEFFYTYRGGKIPGLVVSVPAASGLPFQVRREGWLDDAFKAAGISEEAQTGNPEFDADFYIVCNSPEGVARLFSTSDTRGAVRQCFRHGCEELKHDGAAVSVVLYLSDRAGDHAARVSAVVPHLGVLATALRKIAPAVLTNPAPRWRIDDGPGYGLAIAIFGGLGAAALAALVGYSTCKPVDEGAFAVRALAVSVPAAVLIAVALVRLLKGPAMPPGALFLILLAVLLGVPTLGWAGGGWLNAALDTGPATVHVVPVLGSEVRSGKHRSYVVMVGSWRPGGAPVEIVDRLLFTHMQAGTSLVEVTTRPGFFGFEWVADRSWRSPPVSASPSRK